MASSPIGHYVAVTMVAAIRLSGPLACRSFVGAMNGDRFRDWVATALCPSLSEGDVVVMDNLSVHKDKASIAFIEAAGARVVFLPPYSPDLNPDEKLWSKNEGDFARHSGADCGRLAESH